VLTRLGIRVATIAACLLLAAAAGAQTAADRPPDPAPPEPAVTWGAEIDVVSQYVWRGFQYSDGVAVWPTAWAQVRGFTASLFLNFDHAWDPRWNEYDLTVTYERTVGRWTLSGGYTRYVYYEGERKDATSEIIARTELAAGPGAIFTTHAFDVETYQGSYYLEVGYAVEREIGAKTRIAADASVAVWSPFIDRYTQGTDAHITDGTIGPLILNVSCARRLAPAIAIRPHLTFTRIGDASGRRLLDPPAVTAGVALVIGR
jgi:hypothetical protein